jgi:hypothetical protein
VKPLPDTPYIRDISVSFAEEEARGVAQLRDHDTTANTLHPGHTAAGQGHNMGSIFETESFNASGHLGDAVTRDCGPFDGDTSRDYELEGTFAPR